MNKLILLLSFLIFGTVHSQKFCNSDGSEYKGNVGEMRAKKVKTASGKDSTIYYTVPVNKTASKNEIRVINQKNEESFWDKITIDFTPQKGYPNNSSYWEIFVWFLKGFYENNPIYSWLIAIGLLFKIWDSFD